MSVFVGIEEDPRGVVTDVSLEVVLGDGVLSGTAIRFQGEDIWTSTGLQIEGTLDAATDTIGQLSRHRFEGGELRRFLARALWWNDSKINHRPGPKFLKRVITFQSQLTRHHPITCWQITANVNKRLPPSQNCRHKGQYATIQESGLLVPRST